MPESRLILDSISQINSRIQGPNPIQGYPLDRYPKGLITNRFPSLHKKPKSLVKSHIRSLTQLWLFGSFFWRSSEAGCIISNFPYLTVTTTRQKLTRVGIHINSHADMFLYVLNSPAP